MGGARGACERPLPHRSHGEAHPDATWSIAEASFRARVTTTWLVTSEGTIVRKSEAQYEESFAAGTQAADGMSIDRSYSSTGASPADLERRRPFDQACGR
jgi:hypothetical protein